MKSSRDKIRREGFSRLSGIDGKVTTPVPKCLRRATMFSKLFFAVVISTLAMSTFSSESTQAGRYRVEGPGNSGGSSVQAGRYRASSGNVGSNNAGSNADQGSNSWAQVGQSTQAGRYRQGGSNFAPSTGSFNSASEYAQTRTQRGVATDVSYTPGTNPATPCGCK